MFERYTCWEADEARRILRPLALEGNEALFRATHSPISGLVLSGTEAHEVKQATEQGLLSALSAPERRHAMCVVEGEAGSGKSHIIRWLKVNWPKCDDLPILIERADGTLEGTLRQLSEKLSREVGTNLESLVPRHKLTEQGQRGSLLLQLANLCRSHVLAEPLEDEEWCEKHGLSDMLQSEAVRTMWRAPERILEVLTRGADRDSKVARFTAQDVLEIKQPLAGLRGKNVGPGAIRLAHLLRTETQVLAAALSGSPGAGDDPDLSTIAPHTTRFLAALNSRLSLAIQQTMGISGAALQKIFRDLRRALKTKGRRLVLLLEDITGAQGVDQELLYVLQEKSTTQESFCDVVSVIGVTPAYYRQFISPQANVVQRISHHVRFGQADGSFQTVRGIAEREEQVSFAAKYLRAVRAGMAEIEQAAADGREVRNRCHGCAYRDDCHRDFGQVDDVGLFPLTEKAIGRMFSALKDPMGAMFLQTPRALIQAVLAPSLLAEIELKAGTFPTRAVETGWHQQSMRDAHGLARELIDAAPEQDRERLRIAVAWWGEGEFPVAGDAAGEWAGVPDGVFKAWGLARPSSPSHIEPPAPVADPEASLALPSEPLDDGHRAIDSTGLTRSAKAPVKPAAKPAKRQPPKAKLDEQFERLNAWLRTGKLYDDGFWGSRVEAFIQQIRWKAEDVPHLFTADALGEVRLQGSGKTDSRNVVIPCEPWAVRGLEWSAKLEYDRVSPREREFAYQAIAVFAQRVREVVLRWISSRVPEAQPAGPWHCDATVVQVLLVRAWLRGETHPSAPMVAQWKVILSDDSSTGTNRRVGATTWNNTLERLAGDSTLHRRLRSLADSSGAIADVAFAAPAIKSLVEQGRLDPVPDSLPEQPVKTKWLTTLAGSAKFAAKALDELPTKECTRLRGRATGIIEAVGNANFPSYFERAAQAFGQVRQGLPAHAPSKLSAWFQQYNSKLGLLKAGPNTERDALLAFLTARSWESLSDNAPVPLLLDHAIRAPAEPLEAIHGLVKDTAALVNELVDYLEQHEADGARVQNPAIVVEFGVQVAQKAALLKEALS